MENIDHIGIAVEQLDAELRRYTEDFGGKLLSRETVTEQKVEIVFISFHNSKIELLAPTSKESTIRKFLDKNGPGLHHICYRVSDIKAELKRLESLGYQLIDKTPRHGAHNSKIAFIHPKSCGGVLIELCEY
jgi:methylmalonyl-CoA/ethylmalonyl-CoA epimerase